MSLVKTFALLQLLLIMNNVSVQAVTLGIQGGSTVHVGDRVNITCTCDYDKCFVGVHFRISGVYHNFSTLEGGGVTNYNLGYTSDWNTLTFIYTLVLVNATVNDNGTTYQCTPSTYEGEGNWSNTETLTVLGLAPVREASILQIAGGNVVQEGSDVAIECKCGGHGPDIVCWEYPTFEINGIPHSGGDIADGRYPGYSIAYNFFSQVFKLTAQNVSRSQNGSTYQCGLKDHDGDVILRSNTVTMIVTTTGGPSQIMLSLDPQPALIGDDVGIRCSVMQIPVQPRIAVNDKEETIHTLANSDKYTLTSSTITNGVAVYVLTLHNVSVSDNGTRFECYVRSSGSRITSGTRVLRVVYKDILMTTTTTTTTKLEEISITSSSENPTFPLRTINTYEWPIPTTTTATTTTTTTTTKANFATPITKPTATPVQPTPAMLGQTSVSIEGGGRVEVGDNVSIICLCTGNFNCYSHGVVFRISGRDYTYSQLNGHVPQYSIRHGDTSLRKQEVVLTLTQATLDNDGTTYKCKIFPDNWDQANMVTLSVIGGPSTIPTAPTTVEGSLYTTDLSEIVSTHVLTLEQSTFCVSPTILVAPETSTVELYAILIPVGVLVALLVISLLIIMIVSIVLVKRRRHERGINELEIKEILEERKENSYVM